MRAGWETFTLGEIEKRGLIELGRGKVISKKDLAADPGKYPVYSAAKDNDGKFGERGSYMFDEELITWTVDGGGRLFHRPHHKFSITNVGGFLRILEPSAFNYRFLFYALSWQHSRVNFDWVKKAHPSVLRKVYDTIPIPSLEEQTRIVAMLDDAFSAITVASKNLQLNLTHSESMVSLMFDQALDQQETLSWIELEEVCKAFEYGTSSKSFPEGKMPVLRMGNIQSGNLDWKKLKYSSKVEDNEKYLLNEGDVLFNRTNSAEHVGKSAIYRGEREAIFAGYLVRVVYDKDKISGEFLNRFLNGRIARNYGSTVMSKSVNQANISAGKLKKYPFPNLSLEQQKQILDKLTKILNASNDLTEKYYAQLEDLKNLRQSLLQRAFEGELKPVAPISAVNDNERNERLSTATLVLAFEKHLFEQRQNTFGHVKAQKTLHLTESIGGLDLGRQPQVRQAGPHDHEHFKRVEVWAKRKGVFEFKQRRSGGYTFNRGANYDAFLSEAKTLLADYEAGLSRFVPLIVDMNTQEAEIFTTVHAAWNNLLTDDNMPSDDDIVKAARENWHESKMEIARQRFFDAISKIRRYDLEPDGTAKYVHGAQESLI